MQDGQEQDGADGLFGRWRTRLAQAILREPSIILIDRDADSLFVMPGSDDAAMPAREMVN